MFSSGERALGAMISNIHVEKSDMVQNRAIDIFGVHRFISNLAITVDIGWSLVLHRRWIIMTCLWNPLIDRNHNRLVKNVSLYDDFNLDSNNICCSGIKTIFQET